ncbi:polyketide cyclase [Curtobacterium sp. MCBA15_001]|nr:polyketide cyclase [Curtobacterium sp. MCBA15_001]
MDSTIRATHDVDALTMTFTCVLDAPVDRVWQLWADPRQLERWWGPPDWPATFERHVLVPGERSTYVMTGPDGSRSAGYWVVESVDAPHRLVIEDCFADEHGAPDRTQPTMRMVVTLEDLGGSTRMTDTAHLGSAEELERLLEMGMREGMLAALGQIDGILRG